MELIAALLAWVALVAGVVTLCIGVAAGRGNAALETLIYAGMATLVLQLFAAIVATVHGRLLADGTQAPDHASPAVEAGVGQTNPSSASAQVHRRGP